MQGAENVVPGYENGNGHARELSLLSHSAKEVLFALLTQVPSVPALARMAKIAIPVAAGVENGQKPTADQLKTIVACMLPIEAGMSAFADNVAAYLFAEEVLTYFFKQTFGDDILRRTPMLESTIAIICVKIAEMAGSLTKVGNGPNFSQFKLKLKRTGANVQGVAIDRIDQPIGETLTNGFAHTANTTFTLAAVAYLRREIDTIAAELATTL